jgi:sterol desaturase/sphingolipid hydroxylase (fatty acid hydroxylase superfamily)
MLPEFKLWLKEIAGSYYTEIREFILIFLPIFKADSRFYWPYFIATVILVLMIYIFRDSKRKFRLKDFLSYAVPKNIYLNWSSILDYKFFVVNSILRIILKFGMSEGFALIVAVPLTSALIQTLGPVQATHDVDWTTGLIYGGALFIATDLGFFVGHYLSHRVPLIWEFHKVHHAAEVLNPITNYRFHPLDTIFLAITMGIFIGLVNGVAAYYFGAPPEELTVLKVGFFVFIFSIPANLRHYHVWLSFGPVLSRVFSSPAMHQIHHSTAERHWDKNMSLYLSLWDRFTGTLYVPKEQETFECGLAGLRHREFDTVLRLYLLPFKNAYRLLTRSFGRGFIAQVLWRPAREWGGGHYVPRADNPLGSGVSAE